MSEPMQLFRDQELLLKLARARMPFGKYEGVLLVNLPEPYVVWFAREGFPAGELGKMLAIVHEIKVNGLEYLFKPLLGEQLADPSAPTKRGLGSKLDK
jgi:uncharacterized protein (DUF3820 family)